MSDNLKEVQDFIGSGLYFPSYTHVNADSSRKGIEKTGKIMAPRIALANGIIPFSGEELWYTFMFRSTHVSVSEYPTYSNHPWQRYLSYGCTGWTPERSRELVDMFTEFMKTRVDERIFSLVDFEFPFDKVDTKIQLEGCIELERNRQEAYREMSPEEQQAIRNPEPDIYVFDEKLDKSIRREMVGREHLRFSHPFVPCEIKLQRYLLGMFTSSDTTQTRDWVEEIAERPIPVASIGSLQTCETLMKGFYGEDFKKGDFYRRVRNDEPFRQDIVAKVMEL